MKFTTGEIISVGNGALCCEIGGVYKALNFLTGDDLMTHQLPRAFRECQSHVLGQFPWLLLLPKIDGANWREVVDDCTAKYGAEHEMTALPSGRHAQKNPIDELIEMRGSKEGIIVCEI
jgi:hypothetical protein